MTFQTSTGHQTVINWTGTFPIAQIYYTSQSAGVCGGSAYLNSGGTTPSNMYGKWMVFSGSLNSLMVPTSGSLQADGTALTVQPGAGAIQGIDNPACGPSASNQMMWPLATITRAAVGLPATIATPLHIE